MQMRNTSNNNVDTRYIPYNIVNVAVLSQLMRTNQLYQKRQM